MQESNSSDVPLRISESLQKHLIVLRNQLPHRQCPSLPGIHWLTFSCSLLLPPKSEEVDCSGGGRGRKGLSAHSLAFLSAQPAALSLLGSRTVSGNTDTFPKALLPAPDTEFHLFGPSFPTSYAYLSLLGWWAILFLSPSIAIVIIILECTFSTC